MNKYVLFLVKVKNLAYRLGIHDIVYDISDGREKLVNHIDKKNEEITEMAAEGKSDYEMAKKSLERSKDPAVTRYIECNAPFNNKWYHMWWMKLPNNLEYVFGSCDGAGPEFLRNNNHLKRTAPMNYLFHRSSIPKWHIIFINKTFKTGSIIEMRANGKVVIERHNLDIKELLSKQYGEKYAQKVSKEFNIPFDQLMSYLSKYSPYWEKEIVVDYLKVKEQVNLNEMYAEG